MAGSRSLEGELRSAQYKSTTPATAGVFFSLVFWSWGMQAINHKVVHSQAMRNEHTGQLLVLRIQLVPLPEYRIGAGGKEDLYAARCNPE
jgi:hypothetical protein